jgi:hypothetical protein
VCKQFEDWTTDGREINVYTSSCAVPADKTETESSLIFHSFFLPFAYSNTSQTYSYYELETFAVDLCKQIGDWAMDGREINFYTSSCAMHPIYGKPLGGKEKRRLQHTANWLEGLKLDRHHNHISLLLSKCHSTHTIHLAEHHSTYHYIIKLQG